MSENAWWWIFTGGVLLVGLPYALLAGVWAWRQVKALQTMAQAAQEDTYGNPPR